jgi:hypothetical protein
MDLRRWLGLRCLLRCCPCDTLWLDARKRDQLWAVCRLCHRPRLHLATLRDDGDGRRRLILSPNNLGRLPVAPPPASIER